MGGDFNQVDASCPDLWNELLVHAQVLDTHPQLHTFESPTGSSALDRVLCPTDYIAAAQIDVMVAANRRHHLSGHYQLTATFVVRPRVKIINSCSTKYNKGGAPQQKNPWVQRTRRGTQHTHRRTSQTNILPSR